MGDMISVDWVAVIVATVLNMIINFVWYSRWLFGKEWLSLSKIKESEMKGTGGAVAASLVVSFLLAFILAWFEGQLGITTVQDGLFVGFCVWLGFIATVQSSAVIWCKKPFKLFLIETGNRLVATLVMAGVIGA
jgi:hypothetical protein